MADKTAFEQALADARDSNDDNGGGGGSDDSIQRDSGSGLSGSDDDGGGDSGGGGGGGGGDDTIQRDSGSGLSGSDGGGGGGGDSSPDVAGTGRNPPDQPEPGDGVAGTGKNPPDTQPPDVAGTGRNPPDQPEPGDGVAGTGKNPPDTQPPDNAGTGRNPPETEPPKNAGTGRNPAGAGAERPTSEVPDEAIPDNVVEGPGVEAGNVPQSAAERFDQQQLREQAQELERRAVEQSDAFEQPGDVSIRFEDGSLVARPTREVAERQFRETAAEVEQQAIEQDPRVDDPTDVAVAFEDGAFVAEPTQAAQAEQDIEAVGRARQQLRDQLGRSLPAGVLEKQGDRIELTGEGERVVRETVAENVSEQTGANIERQDIRRVADGFALSRTGQRRAAAAQNEDVSPGDLEVKDGDIQLTEQAIEERATEQLDIDAEAGEDIEINRSARGAQVELTTEGRQETITSDLLVEGEIEVDKPSATVPTGRGGQEATIGGGSKTIDIERARQLQFDDEGNLVGVNPPETTQAEIEAGKERIANAIPVPVLGPAAAKFAFDQRRNLNIAGDVSTDVGQAFSENVVQPGADLVGDVGDVGVGQLRRAATPIVGKGVAPEGGAEEVRERAADLSRAPANEIQDESLGESVSTDFSRGVGGIVRAGIELPETARAGSEVAGEGAAFTAQTIDEQGVASGSATAAAAGGEAAVGVAETVAVETINNPVKSTGMLVGSGAIFKAARAVGPNTSIATRAAIQPGEELAGFGGAGLFRRLPGERTTAAGQKLFPQNEPLIFSEEAAIRTAQRAGAAARRGAGKVRDTAATASSRLSRDISEFRRDTAAELGGKQRSAVETETEPETITAEDIAERKPVRPAEERTEVGQFERRRGQRRRQEFEQEGRDFDTENPTTMMERRAAKRQRERQATEQELRETAQRREVTDTRSRLNRDTAEITVLDREAATRSEVLAEAETLQQSELQQSDVRLDQRIDTELSSELRTETRIDQEVSTRVDLELDQRLQQEVRLDQEFELERELEQELEQEVEQETEQEIEVESDDDEKMEEIVQSAGGGSFKKVFASKIASAEDVLNFELGNT